MSCRRQVLFLGGPRSQPEASRSRPLRQMNGRSLPLIGPPFVSPSQLLVKCEKCADGECPGRARHQDADECIVHKVSCTPLRCERHSCLLANLTNQDRRRVFEGGGGRKQRHNDQGAFVMIKEGSRMDDDAAGAEKVDAEILLVDVDR